MQQIKQQFYYLPEKRHCCFVEGFYFALMHRHLCVALSNMGMESWVGSGSYYQIQIQLKHKQGIVVQISSSLRTQKHTLI